MGSHVPGEIQRRGFVNEHCEEKNLEKFLKNIPGIFPVSVVAEQIGNRDQQQGVRYCQIHYQS